MIITAGWLFDLDTWAEDNELTNEPVHEVQRDIQLAVDATIRRDLGEYLLPDREGWDGKNKVVEGIILVSWRFDTRRWAEDHDTTGLKADEVRAQIQTEIDSIVRAAYLGYVTSEKLDWKALVR